jgi:hypothetical protein
VHRHPDDRLGVAAHLGGHVMTFDDDNPITYRAVFDCGHSARYEAANTEDIALLQEIASQRLCAECTYKIGTHSLMLRHRVEVAS